MAALFVVFEGIDGSGKSTAMQHLKKEYNQVTTSAEPTRGGLFGKKIRSILGSGKVLDEKLNNQLLELFRHDRLWHTEQVIKPALAAGRLLLLDRYFFSTAAYQSFSNQQTMAIANSYLADERFVQPDLVFYFNIETDMALGRIQGREQDREIFEYSDRLKKIAGHYHHLWKHIDMKSRLVQLDASLPQKDTLKMMKTEIERAGNPA